jgi:hypothetical protein
MMPMHDPDGLRRRERELRDAAERARRARDAQGVRDEVPAPAEPPPASVTVLPELVAEEPCVACDLARERTSA